MVDRPDSLESQQATLDGYIAAARTDPGGAVDEIKIQALSILRLITLSPKPSYTIGGKSIKHGEYVKTLTDLITWATEEKPEVIAGTEGPWQFETEAF